MKTLVLLAAIALPAVAQAQNNSLSGNWRESKRTDSHGAYMDFRDTIKIQFLNNNEYTWMKKNGFIYRGTYKIENGALDMGSRFFKVVRQSPERLVLRDDAATYEFQPYTEAAPNRLPEEKEAVPVSEAQMIAGKWKVFKGTSAETIKELDLANRIKTVMIFDRPDAQGDIGYISGGKDAKNDPSWKINRLENGILYCNGKTVRVFEVSRRDKELILKEGSMTYFLKQFSE